MRLGTSELILILIIALVLFGGGKIAGLGKAVGTSMREFKEAFSGTAEAAKSALPEKEDAKQ